VSAGIAQPQARDPGAGAGGEGLADLAQRGLADGGIVAESFDGEQPPVGLEADGPQGGQVSQPFADAEVAGVVDGGLGPEGSSFLVVYLQGPATLSTTSTWHLPGLVGDTFTAACR